MAILGDAERIGLLQRERWIDYPRASEALGRLLRLLHTPERQRMPCMMLHGPSNIGKTLIIAKFLREHPPVFDEPRGIERRQIFALQMPPTPDQASFYRALLFELGAPQAARTTLAAFEQLARDQVLPLRHSSDLQQRPFVQLLVAANNGLLGDVSRILNTAAERAILDNSERITLRHLQQACDARS